GGGAGQQWLVSLPDTSTIRRRVVVLGSTGSIGTQTLEAIAHCNALADRGLSRQRFEIVGLAAGRRAETLAAQARRYSVPTLALADPEAVLETPARCFRGPDAPEQLVRKTRPDLVVAAMVGAAGLPATLAAAELGIDIALANKETLVAAGHLVVPLARRTGSRLLPIDSEHSGLWQCLQGLCPRGEHLVPPCRPPEVLRRAIITASGGPFRTTPLDAMRSATLEQALAHPTWSMGQKNTIDSATMINKGLELIEAHWLFGLDGDRLGVLVHPQSIVHAIAELADGSSIAQLSAPDMRCPIQLALTWPNRLPGCCEPIDWRTLSRLDFAEPDPERFPAIGLAFEVIRRGGPAGTIFNAANEVAVQAFLDRSIPFGRIVEIVAEAMDHLSVGRSSRPPATLDEVMELDATARDFARSSL
ncbi:1-deoxy-D-xylulose 5-phosphate reductoisomerase, partial [hydrothermal vent metagenome]